MVHPTEQQIAQQNDQFRRDDPSVPGIWVITADLGQLLKQLDIVQTQLPNLQPISRISRNIMFHTLSMI